MSPVMGSPSRSGVGAISSQDYFDKRSFDEQS
jgi:hypothetical protein